LPKAQNRTQLLAALAPLLDEDLQRDVLEGVKEIDNDLIQADILTKVFPYVQEPLLDLSVTRIQEFEDVSPWTQAVVALTPRMAELGHHQDAVDAAAQIDWERGSTIEGAPCPRATALIGIARHLAPDERTSVLGRAVADAMTVSDHLMRSLALAQLAPQLPESLTELKQRALRTALDATRNIDDADARSSALALLGPSLREPLLGEALSLAVLLPEGPYVNQSLRATALSGLATRLSELPSARLYKLWCNALRELAKWTRPGLLWDIPAVTPVLTSLGGTRAAADAARTIFDVASAWP
jgi:hypothetical protein